MFPVRFRQNQSDELPGGFVDDNVSGVLPSGFTSNDGSSGNADESYNESGDSCKNLTCICSKQEMEP